MSKYVSGIKSPVFSFDANGLISNANILGIFNVTNNTTGDTVTIQNTISAATIPIFNVFAPNLSAGGNVISRVGVSSTINNSAEISFTYTGLNNVANGVRLGFFSNSASAYTLTAAGIHTFIGTSINITPALTCSSISCSALAVSSFIAPVAQGTSIGWNRDGSGGITSISNQHGQGTGGFEFLSYNNANALTAIVASISSVGNIICSGLNTQSGAILAGTLTCTGINSQNIFTNGQPINSGTVQVINFVIPTVPGSTFGWNRIGSGKAVIANQQGTNAGGFEFLNYNSSNVLLSSAVSFDVNANVSCAAINTNAGSLTCGLLMCVNGTSSENLIQNSGTGSAASVNLFMPNLSVGGNSYTRTGVSVGNFNSAELTFNYVGANNLSNSFGIGFFGVAALYKVTAAGVHTFIGGAVNINAPLSCTNTINTNGNAITAGSIQLLNFSTPTSQGLTLGWNRGGNGGRAVIANQQGGGTGGFEFINYNNSNVLLGSAVSFDVNANINCAAINTNAGSLTCGLLMCVNGTNSENLIQNSGTGSAAPVNFFMPNLSVGNNSYTRTGVGVGNYNSAELTFNYVGANNLSNSFGIGFFGVAALYKVTAAGTHTFIGGSVTIIPPISCNNITCSGLNSQNIFTNGQPINCGGVNCTQINANGNAITAGSIQLLNFSTPTSQGLTLGWNRGGGGGRAVIANQQGGGTGGFEFINYNNSNVLSGNSVTFDSAANVNCNAITSSGGASYFFGGTNDSSSPVNAYCNGTTISSAGPTPGGYNIGAYFINGVIFQAGWFTRSDIRIKTDIVAITDPNILNEINPCTYTYIDNKKNNGIKRKYGLIAQQVETVLPDVINTESGVIPNIMKLAKKISQYSFALDYNIKIGKIRIYTQDSYKPETILDCNIISKIDNIYTVDAELSELIYIYGEFVSDLKSVDYNAFIPILVAGYKQQHLALNNQELRIKRLETLLLEKQLI